MTTSPPDFPPDTPARPSPSVSATKDAAGTRRDTLDYMRSMLAELSAIARRQRLDMLAYLIEMASVEATDALARDGTAARRRGGGRRPGASDQ